VRPVCAFSFSRVGVATSVLMVMMLSIRDWFVRAAASISEINLLMAAESSARAIGAESDAAARKRSAGILITIFKHYQNIGGSASAEDVRFYISQID
jgi:hypothetical protein